MLALCLWPAAASAQDASPLAAGGLVSLDDAPLTVVREHISIRPDRVLADYTFRNDTRQPIQTTLAFLVPDYTVETDHDYNGREAFDDAQLTVNGAPADFDPDVRAMLGHEDVTRFLETYRIDIATFGHPAGGRNNEARLAPDELAHLLALGIYARAGIYDVDPMPRWTVVKRYIHPQDFAPGASVRVQLSYTPVPGAINSVRSTKAFDRDIYYSTAAGTAFAGDAYQQLRGLCPSAQLTNLVQKFIASPQRDAGLVYVDFLLRGEHSWKGPIADFALQVDNPTAEAGTSYAPSACWQGVAHTTTLSQWQASAAKILQPSDLHVGWVQLDGSTF